MSYYPPTDWMLKDFYREYADSLFGCCSFLTCGQADAQKMVRDIFMRMLTKGISFSSDKDAKAWLMLTAYKMSKKPPVATSGDEKASVGAGMDCDASPAEGADREQVPDAVHSVDMQQETESVQESVEFPLELQRLSRKDRLIAAFYYCEGFRKAEIAKYLGWTTFMVSHRLRRIRKKVLHEKGGEEAC